MGDTFHLRSTAFSNDGRIHRKHTADGPGVQKDISPQLQWYNVPEGTESLAIIVEDVDAPDPDNPIVPFVHWVVVNIPPTLKSLPEGFNQKDVEGQNEYGDLQEGVNDFKVPGYRGPLPPKGTHRIEFRLYALDTKVKLGNKPTAPKLLDEYGDHIIEQTVLTGRYSRDPPGKGGPVADTQSLTHN